MGIIFSLLAGCAQPEASTDKKTEQAEVELTISAAASLMDALNESKAVFEQKYPGMKLTYNFGGSGKLAQQITQGAPADLFLSASAKDMDRLQAKELLLADSRRDFARNELVLIAPQNSPLSIDSFDQIDPAAVRHFAIGEPASVPAGTYAKQVLQNLKLWEEIQPKLVFSSDVRQVLAYVESGDADVGVIYSSDAVIGKGIKVLATAQSQWHEPIVYPGAVLAASAHPAEAQRFLAFIMSEEGKRILQKYGFQT
ncbi:molybdate ABC transporter substrate-binding protein [Brevibacillus fulvus]|nr:molybdate ABC transporter substrate-binding protein [Brevibacillus fulvus]